MSDKRKVLVRLLEQENAKHSERVNARDIDQIAMRCLEKYRR